MNHLRSRMRPNLCVLLGDLNSTGAPGTPLASALGALGPLSAWHRLVPPATPTNFTTTDCRECSRRAGRIIHPDKQEFSLIDSRPGRPSLVTADVPQHTGTTTTAPPEVVGIPILPELPLLRVSNKSRASLDRARNASRNHEACPILQLRSLHTLGLSPLDYVTSGVLIPPPPSAPIRRPSTTPTTMPSVCPPGHTRPSSTPPSSRAVPAPPS